MTTELGEVNETAIAKLCSEVAELYGTGSQVVVVTSGAIAAGVQATGQLKSRPSDLETLQAIASVGQPKLMRVYAKWLERYGLSLGQILLAPNDFSNRKQYLQARQTIKRLLELGVVPVVNENDPVADDEIRFGDNDRLAALVANMINADRLVILTDTAGLYSKDPRFNSDATLIEDVQVISREIELIAGDSGTTVGSGGMASKLAAAKIATWSGIGVTICDAKRKDVLIDACYGKDGVGTTVAPSPRNIGSRKLWLAFAVEPRGQITVDGGATRALAENGRSLLAPGVLKATGDFDEGELVEVLDEGGSLVARGLALISSGDLERFTENSGATLVDGPSPVVIHRDDMVVLCDLAL